MPLNEQIDHTMRDTRKPKSHFDNYLKSRHARDFEKDHVAEYVKTFEKLQKIKSGVIEEFYLAPLDKLRIHYVESFLENIAYAYSRGDGLDTIKEKYIDEALDRYVILFGELEKHADLINAATTPAPYPKTMANPPEVHAMYLLLSWLVCFGADEQKIRRIAPQLCEPGHDRLADTVLNRYQGNRVIAEAHALPDTYRLIQESIDAPEEKTIDNLQHYLDTWGQRMGSLTRVKVWGHSGCCWGATSNESLYANTKGNYCGFWAWEVALVVRFFNIDDSTFEHHPLYPTDLARYRAC